MKRSKHTITTLNRPRQKEARTNRVTILLNDSELRALERYYDKYGIKNHSRFVRETLMRTVLKQFEKDAPTLFD